jgi:hypothetical protein
MTPSPSSGQCVTLGTAANAVAPQNQPFGCTENFRCVRSSNGDMSYVFSLSTLETGPRLDLYTMDDLDSFPGMPIVIAHIESRASSAQGVASAAPIIRSGGDLVAGGSAILTDEYTDYSTTFVTDPSTGMPWTISGINNLEAGVRHTVLGSIDARTTAVWLEICPAPPTPTPTATLPLDCDGGEFQVNTTTTVDQYDPDVAKDAAGNFVVVWTDAYGDGSQYAVKGQRFFSNGAFAGTEFTVNTTTTADQLEPAVSATDNGEFVVVWASYYGDFSSTGVFGQRYSSNGNAAGTEFQVNTQTAYAQNGPDVAMNGFGAFVVVWQDYYNYGEMIKGQRYFSFGLENGTEFLVNTTTTNYQTRPAVASDPAGNFVVVWETYVGEGGTSSDGSGRAVVGQRYSSDGNQAGTEFVVNTYTTGNQDTADVTMADDGSFVVVWQSFGQDTSGEGVFAQRFGTSGSPAGAEFRVNTVTVNDQENPRVSSAPNGDFTIVWESYGQDGNRHGIFGQRYSASGTELGTEFQVNTYTTGRQAYPAVAADAGNFVVVWEDGDQYIGFETIDPGRGGGAGALIADGQDGSGIGIYAKRFIVFGACGNGIIEGAEVCDDFVETDNCDDDCTAPVCGDGNINQAAGEDCEPPNEGFCDSNCISNQ